jgi:hypothetical protein
MRLLNHYSELITLRYLGLDRENIESTLDKIHFNY